MLYMLLVLIHISYKTEFLSIANLVLYLMSFRL